MKTLHLPADDPDTIPSALAALLAGGLVAFPTDTVYGVGAIAFQGETIEKIYAAKDRPGEKAIPILLAEANELAKVARHVPQMAQALAARFWPGPLTLVVPKAPDLPKAVSATASVAVRVPDHPIARTLLLNAGPMAVTSANLSGLRSPVTADEVMGQLGGRIQLVIDGGRTPGGIPSTLVDCLGEEPRILREGPITAEQIEQALRDS
jgi:L-threonylcarbamoyladenylate synthase